MTVGTIYLPNVRKDEHFFTSQNSWICQVRTESGLLYMESKCVQKHIEAGGTTSYQSVATYFKAHPSVPGAQWWTGLLKHLFFTVSTSLSFIIRGHWKYATGGKGLLFLVLVAVFLLLLLPTLLLLCKRSPSPWWRGAVTRWLAGPCREWSPTGESIYVSVVGGLVS